MAGNAAGRGLAPVQDVQTVLYGEFLQRGERIRHPNEAAVLRKVGILVHDGPGRTFLQRGGGIGVAVEALTPEGEEYLPARDCTAVGGDAVCTVAIFLVKICHFRNYLVPVLPNPPSPLPEAARASVSSHSMVSWRARTSWAILSPFSTTNSASERLTRITHTSPR